MREGYAVTEKQGGSILVDSMGLPEWPTSVHATPDLLEHFVQFGGGRVFESVVVYLSDVSQFYLLNYNHRDDAAYNVHVVER